MHSSSLSLFLASMALLLGAAGCSHQTSPAGSAADVAHPAIGFSLKGPPAEVGAERSDAAEAQDRPIVDARHGWSHTSPR
jgi:hypothetical protein